MKTYIYMVRHGDSPKTGEERTRGLTEKGILDAERVADILENEGIDVIVSSPYTRSILTVQDLANRLRIEIQIYEDLKERMFSYGDTRIPDKELTLLLEKSFADPTFSLSGGESNNGCQNRAIKVVKELLKTYEGQKVVIGSHGAVMTLMMGYFDSQYDLNFLLQTSKPDIYLIEFSGQELVEVTSLWKGNGNY